MNRKLFALMIVPVVVVMGGTFAFSAWAGSANAFFGQSAASMSYQETLYFVHTNANNTPVKLTYGSSELSATYATGPFEISQQTGNAATTANVYINASNMLPGDYVHFTVNITNHGTSTLNTSTIMFKSFGGQGAFANGNGPLTSGNVYQISALQPPLTQAYLDNFMQTFGHMVFLFNATSTSSTPGILHAGQSISYEMYAILPANAPASEAGTGFSLELTIPIAAMQ